MSYVDIAIIVIVALGALIGLWKGFFKTIISFFGWLVSFLIAFFLTKIVSEALLDVGFIKAKVLGESGSLFTWVSKILPAGFESGEGIWGTLLSPLVTLAQSSGADLRSSVALLLTNGIYSIIVCLALFIAIRIVMLLFTMFANAMTANKAIGALNRLFGFIVGAVKGFGFICIVMVVMSFFVGMNFMAPVRNQLEKSVIGAPLSKKVFQLTDKFIGADGTLLDKLLTMAGIDKQEENTQPSEEEKAHIAAQESLKKALNDLVYVDGISSDDFTAAYIGGNAEYDAVTQCIVKYFEDAAAKLNTPQLDYTTQQLIDFSVAISNNSESPSVVYTCMKAYLEQMKEFKKVAADDPEYDAKIEVIRVAALAAVTELEEKVGLIEAFTSLFGDPFFIPEEPVAPVPAAFKPSSALNIKAVRAVNNGFALAF